LILAPAGFKILRSLHPTQEKSRFLKKTIHFPQNYGRIRPASLGFVSRAIPKIGGLRSLVEPGHFRPGLIFEDRIGFSAKISGQLQIQSCWEKMAWEGEKSLA
jgi:hypothetical protein